jgi:hypothetical protein
MFFVVVAGLFALVIAGLVVAHRVRGSVGNRTETAQYNELKAASAANATRLKGGPPG